MRLNGWGRYPTIEASQAQPATLSAARGNLTLSLIHISEPTRPY